MGEEVGNLTLAGRPYQWTGEGPVWCLVAKMRAVREVNQEATDAQSGNKYFAPGAKLYFRHIVGFRNERIDEPVIEVVGRHRRSHRYIRVIMRAAWVENWRVDLVYSPTVIRLLAPKWDGSEASKAEAEEYLNMWFRGAQYREQ